MKKNKNSDGSLTATYFATTEDGRVWQFSTLIFSVIKDRRLVARPTACCILQVISGQVVPTEYFLKNGSFLGISKLGLILYFQESSINDGRFNSNRKPVEQVKLVDLGDSSKPIVALFLNKKNAIACAKSKNLVEDDKRWRVKTSEVLREIGFGHPFLIISRPKSEHGFSRACYQQVLKKEYASPGKNVEIETEEAQKIYEGTTHGSQTTSSKAQKDKKLNLLSPEDANAIRSLLAKRGPKA